MKTRRTLVTVTLSEWVGAILTRHGIFRWELAALSSLHFARALAPRMAARGGGTLLALAGARSPRTTVTRWVQDGQLRDAPRRRLDGRLETETGTIAVTIARSHLPRDVDDGELHDVPHVL